METQDTNQPRFSDYTRPLTSRWWLIVVAVVVATGGVYAYYARKANVYSASTLVYYQDPGDPITGLPSPVSTDRTVANEASLLDSHENAAAVARQIGYRGTPEQLLGSLSVSSKTGEDFVQVSANAGTPREAATIANAFAGSFVTSLNGAYLARISHALKLSQAQLATTPKGAASDLQTANLLDQVNRLELALRVPTNPARQVNRALAPSSPTSPKPVRNALFALLIALVGSIALAYGLERFDRRLRDPEELERAYGETPLLAVLPHTDDPVPVRDGTAVLGGDFREPFRVLRTNIELASVDAPPRTILVSSAMPGEGKSTVVRNLALAFHEAGRRVAVVDLDLRHPALAGLFFKPAIGPGMTDVLRRDVELQEATIEVGSKLPNVDALLVESAHPGMGGNGATGRNGSGSEQPGVTLLLGGVAPANPPTVLASKRVIEVLDELADGHDIVLIDSAPVLAVTDTVPLLRYADAALFVGRLGVTTRDTAKRLMQFLSRVPDLNLLGVVANDLSRLEAGAYGYGYGYGYGADRGQSKSERALREGESLEQTAV
jgi:Mrp family chromosome partitioning ATPase/capsular polysaccharide biosynthesis protein